MKTSFQSFLLSISKYSASALDMKTPRYFVLGNESCDLDSSFGAISLAYLFTLKESEICVPVLNCKREELESKFMVNSLLMRFSIPLENIIFLKDNQLSIINGPIILYDHNKLSPSQTSLKEKVKIIIDHHKDESEIFYENYKEIERKIEKIGSASTLVFEQIMEYFGENWKSKLIEFPIELLIGLASAISIDSYNFSLKCKDIIWIERDKNAFESLKLHIESQRDIQLIELIQDLNSENTKIENHLKLSFEILCRRDCKAFEFSKAKVISSIFNIPFDSCFSRYGKSDIELHLKKEIEEEDLFGYLLLFVYPENGDWKREILFLSNSNKTKVEEFDKLLIAKLLSRIQTNFERKEYESELFNSFYYRDTQGIVNRKIIAAVLDEILN